MDGLILAIVLLGTGVALAAGVRWFDRYRLTENWRHGDLRAAALSFLVFFGGLFGHRVPPPPRVRTEQIAQPQAGDGATEQLRVAEPPSEAEAQGEAPARPREP